MLLFLMPFLFSVILFFGSYGTFVRFSAIMIISTFRLQLGSYICFISSGQKIWNLATQCQNPEIVLETRYIDHRDNPTTLFRPKNCIYTFKYSFSFSCSEMLFQTPWRIPIKIKTSAQKRSIPSIIDHNNSRLPNHIIAKKFWQVSYITDATSIRSMCTHILYIKLYDNSSMPCVC